MKQKNWSLAGYAREDAVGLVRAGLNPLVAVLLASRGVSSAEAAARLMEDDPGCVSDPFCLTGMDRAAERLRRAIDAGERVAVYGDYDVDGITASCLMASFLRAHGLVCDIYIPERLDEGYGVKAPALAALAGRGVTLVVTVDCGITAVSEVEFAKSLGMDMIITDHHECPERLPDAAAVVNPKRRGAAPCGQGLAGVGVAFKLVCAVAGADRTEALLQEYGDLVAIGTVADVMPVTGENRFLIKRGTEAIRSGRRPGLRFLCEASGIAPEKLTSQHMSFLLAPRLNAAGRLGRTDIAVDLLLTPCHESARRFADELCALNRERQQLEGRMFDESVAMLQAAGYESGPIVLAQDGWHQGVAGIVASRLAEKYCVPAVIICLSDGLGRGSCRSFGGFNLFGALEQTSALLSSFGGHELAAGLTISERDIPAFHAGLAAAWGARGACDRTLHVDFEVIRPALLSVCNVEALGALEPFGSGNPTPVLCIRDAVCEQVIPVSGGRHTKYRLKKGGLAFDSIFFSTDALAQGIAPGDAVDAAFLPQINEFRGRRAVQLQLSDIIHTSEGR